MINEKVKSIKMAINNFEGMQEEELNTCLLIGEDVEPGKYYLQFTNNRQSAYDLEIIEKCEDKDHVENIAKLLSNIFDIDIKCFNEHEGLFKNVKYIGY